MINSLVKLWSISKTQLVEEGSKIFQEKKHFESVYMSTKAELIKSQMKYVVDGPNQKTVIQQILLHQQYFLQMHHKQMIQQGKLHPSLCPLIIRCIFLFH